MYDTGSNLFWQSHCCMSTWFVECKLESLVAFGVHGCKICFNEKVASFDPTVWKWYTIYASNESAAAHPMILLIRPCSFLLLTCNQVNSDSSFPILYEFSVFDRLYHSITRSYPVWHTYLWNGLPSIHYSSILYHYLSYPARNDDVEKISVNDVTSAMTFQFLLVFVKAVIMPLYDVFYPILMSDYTSILQCFVPLALY